VKTSHRHTTTQRNAALDPSAQLRVRRYRVSRAPGRCAGRPTGISDSWRSPSAATAPAEPTFAPEKGRTSPQPRRATAV